MKAEALKKNPADAGSVALRLCAGRFHRREFSVLPASCDELDVAVGGGKQRVVATTAYIDTRVYLRASLADDDVARFDEFAAILFDA